MFSFVRYAGKRSAHFLQRGTTVRAIQAHGPAVQIVQCSLTLQSQEGFVPSTPDLCFTNSRMACEA